MSIQWRQSTAEMRIRNIPFGGHQRSIINHSNPPNNNTVNNSYQTTGTSLQTPNYLNVPKVAETSHIGNNGNLELS